ncbi:LptF/LptG family permease [Aeoliella sp.]|uniref:LptF/LptG family permease n=1 Tax=Aeoliella sp. TaxID=2795800 RepID=UPI003CCBA5BA
MLRIVDRYLLWQFVQIFLICYISLTGLFVVIDAFQNLDDFSRVAKEMNQSYAHVMLEYYGYKSIYFFEIISGVLPLVAAMFTITWIERYNEMTALMAAGVSRLRVLRPVIVAAVIVCLMAAANREVVLPQIREKLASDAKNLGSNRAQEVASRQDTQTGIRIDAEEAVSATQTLSGVSLILPSKLSKYGKLVYASEATYQPADGAKPSGYLLKGVVTPKHLSQRPSLLQDDQPVLVMPCDAGWLKEDEVFLVSNVDFERLLAGTAWRQHASTLELIDELQSPSVDLGNDLRVEVHSRLVKPMLDCTLLFLGLPLVVTRGNRNLYLAVGLAALVVAAYFAVTIGCQSLGNSGWIRPTLAAWLPLIIFCPIAVYLADSLRR